MQMGYQWDFLSEDPNHRQLISLEILLFNRFCITLYAHNNTDYLVAFILYQNNRADTGVESLFFPCNTVSSELLPNVLEDIIVS